MKKNLTAMTLAGVIVASNIMPICADSKFNDVNNHWAKSKIEGFTSKGYINGYQDGSFKPDADITRAEFVKIVNKYFNYKDIAQENFSDVSQNDWFFTEVCIAKAAGYINGYSDGTFKPNKQITREEVASILSNIKNIKDEDYDKINSYIDNAKISNWAKSSIEGNLEEGYLKGNSNGELQPQKNITRAEAVTSLSRVSNNIVEQEIKGKDRYETAGKIADKVGYRTAVLVNSDESLADGLAASGLAGACNAPILLVNKSGIPNETVKRLNGVTKVYIIGGTARIDSKVESDLKAKGIEVNRISGADRTETSVNVSKEIAKIKPIQEVYVVNGYKGEADAVSIGAVAHRNGQPIILTNGTDMPKGFEGKLTYIIGGDDLVSKDIENNTKGNRISGADRFATNTEINKAFFGGAKDFIVTKGYNLVDALTATTLKKPIVLVEKGTDKSILKDARSITRVGGIATDVYKECVGDTSVPDTEKPNTGDTNKPNTGETEKPNVDNNKPNTGDTNKPSTGKVYSSVNDAEFKELVNTEMFKLVNDHRRANGVAPLQRDSRLDRISEKWSQYMIDNEFFAHKDSAGNQAPEVFTESGVQATGENIGGSVLIIDDKGYTVDLVNWDKELTSDFAKTIAIDMFEGWKQSPGHNKNMLNSKYTKFGFGFAEKADTVDYHVLRATQEFMF